MRQKFSHGLFGTDRTRSQCGRQCESYRFDIIIRTFDVFGLEGEDDRLAQVLSFRILRICRGYFPGGFRQSSTVVVLGNSWELRFRRLADQSEDDVGGLERFDLTERECGHLTHSYRTIILEQANQGGSS